LGLKVSRGIYERGIVNKEQTHEHGLKGTYVPCADAAALAQALCGEKKNLAPNDLFA
jgi:hypothetical protein